MENHTMIQERLAFKRKALMQAREAYLTLLSGGVKSYAIGSRNVTRLDLPQLEQTIEKLEKEVDLIEREQAGGKRRRAVGVVPRDW